MSSLRPTLQDATGKPSLTYDQTYLRVFEAVRSRRGLLHGRLNDGQGRACAIGSYFSDSQIAIPSRAIEEIAAYNDSFPDLTPSQRWQKVRRWLELKVTGRLRP